MRLANKVALITGGGTGIGRETALLFAREGAEVVITGRDIKPLEETAQEMGCGFYLEGDVSQKTDVERVFGEVIGKYNHLDVLVNNAGVYGGDVEEMWKVNVHGVSYCSKEAVKYMKQGGSIVNISSVFALSEKFIEQPYSRSKAEVIMMTQKMALEYAGQDVRVNCVCPSAVDTAMLHEATGGDISRLVDEHPLGRIGQPIDIAYGVLYLASDESSWVTGTVLPVDGGFLLSNRFL